MKIQILLFVCIALLFSQCQQPTEKPKTTLNTLTQHVNPFIGTGGHGHTYPGASLPFGMLQLSPDTRIEGWDGCSGYHYSDSVIYGFSHTHLSGTGVGDYNDLLIMPTNATYWNNGYQTSPDSGYASRFLHSTEEASPGYYKVKLDDYNIVVQLATTLRCAMHQYTFPSGDGTVMLDLTHRDQLLDVDLKATGKNELVGFRRSKAWAEDQHFYFVVQTNWDFEEAIIQQDSIILADQSTQYKPLKAALKFKNLKDNQLRLRVGISAVSIEGARKNLEKELNYWQFETVRAQADSIWNSELQKVVVETDNQEQKTIFYTALYHSFLNPNLFMDVDGQYRSTDGKVHQSNDFDNYTVFSLWDTFRGTHPLFTILQRKRSLDFIKTFLAQYQNGGKLPVWELAGNYTGCMIGYHSVSVIADAYNKGIQDFDVDLALEAMQHSANQMHLGLDVYQHKGFIAAGDEPESVSKTLEYAYDDWCIAQFAKATGKEEVYQQFLERGQYYKNIYDPTSKFMRAKMHGSWFSPFDPAEVNYNYTEANSWQYSLFAPQDIQGLIELLGGNDELEQWLDNLFAAQSDLNGRHQVDITGLIGQYAHGNEPSHHMAYLYNFIGKPWKTQERVRQILEELYTTQPDGLSGNEDCGQMSSWYNLSAMGFYSVTPALDYYVIGTPIFDKTTLNLENGKQFTIIANGVSKENKYIQSAKLNGQTYNKSYLKHSDILAGGELIFELGNQANLDWGSDATAIPKAHIQEHLITPVPYFVAKGNVFADTMTIELGVACTDCKIYYTLDGNIPSNQATLYNNPILLTTTTTIQAIAISNSQKASFPIQNQYLKITDDKKIQLNSQYANQYAAGGDKALIDYLKGSNNYRTGFWQGYREDLDVVIDLGEVKFINKISTGFLQDIKSWIWFPTSVEYELSIDGERFKSMATVQNDFSASEYGAFTKEFEFDPHQDMRARYVRVRAKNYGICPPWHLGAGGATWLFVDEITIE